MIISSRSEKKQIVKNEQIFSSENLQKSTKTKKCEVKIFKKYILVWISLLLKRGSKFRFFSIVIFEEARQKSQIIFNSLIVVITNNVWKKLIHLTINTFLNYNKKNQGLLFQLEKYQFLSWWWGGGEGEREILDFQRTHQ